MTKSVDFYYDYGSPTAYLAWTQLPAICAKHGAILNYQPILLGGIFKAVDNQSPVMVKPKGEWLLADVERFAKRYGVPYRFNPHFIVNTISAMRGAMWAKSNGTLEAYNKAMFNAMWADGLDVSDAQVLKDVVSSAGLDAAAMADAILQQDVKQALIDATTAATARGIFGAPTMFVGDEMHFGQDRLDWVEQAIAA